MLNVALLRLQTAIDMHGAEATVDGPSIAGTYRFVHAFHRFELRASSLHVIYPKLSRLSWLAREGSAHPLGSTWIAEDNSLNFSICSRHAERVVLQLYRSERDNGLYVMIN